MVRTSSSAPCPSSMPCGRSSRGAVSGLHTPVRSRQWPSCWPPEWRDWGGVLNFLASASVRPGNVTFAGALVPVDERFRVKSGSERGRGGSCERGSATPSSTMASIRWMSSLVRSGGRAWAGGRRHGIETRCSRPGVASPWADGEHGRRAQLMVSKLKHCCRFHMPGAGVGHRSRGTHIFPHTRITPPIYCLPQAYSSS